MPSKPRVRAWKGRDICIVWDGRKGWKTGAIWQGRWVPTVRKSLKDLAGWLAMCGCPELTPTEAKKLNAARLKAAKGKKP